MRLEWQIEWLASAYNGLAGAGLRSPSGWSAAWPAATQSRRS